MREEQGRTSRGWVGTKERVDAGVSVPAAIVSASRGQVKAQRRCRCCRQGTAEVEVGWRALPAAPRSPCGRCSTAERVSRSATYLLCKWAGPCRHWSQVVGAVWRMARSPSETPCGTHGSVESSRRDEDEDEDEDSRVAVGNVARA